MQETVCLGQPPGREKLQDEVHHHQRQAGQGQQSFAAGKELGELVEEGGKRLEHQGLLLHQRLVIVNKERLEAGYQPPGKAPLDQDTAAAVFADLNLPLVVEQGNQLPL